MIETRRTRSRKPLAQSISRPTHGGPDRVKAQQRAAARADGAASAGGSKDDVLDAEFEEVKDRKNG